MGGRAVWAEIDLRAIRHNVTLLREMVAPAEVCAVVKAGAYGHGAVPVAQAMVDAGATWLAVAFVEEGAALRDAGIGAPVLLLSEPPTDAMDDVVALGLTPTIYTMAGVEAAAKAVAGRSSDPLAVHVKVDTGMHRVGAAPKDAVQLALAVDERPELVLEGLWTHFAVADDPGQASFTAGQAARLESVVDQLGRAGVRPRLVHACNSAGALTHPACHKDMVRCGIALYGVAPTPSLAGIAALRPALALRARVSHVFELAAGEALSYGLRYRVERPTVVATVPIGYADGVPWQLGVEGGEVLLRGRRRPVAGTVTMDQIMIDCGEVGGSSDAGAVAGDEVVLLGSQGGDYTRTQGGDYTRTQGGSYIDAWEWAERTATIAYDILCGIGPRVPRVYT